MESTKKQSLFRILLYVGITFALTWGYCLLVLYPSMDSDNLGILTSLITVILTAAAMFIPSIGVLLTRLITKEGFRDSWLKLNLNKNIRWYLLAWFGPGVLTLLGAVLYFLLNPQAFDLSCGYLATTIEATGVSADTAPIPLNLIMLLSLAQGLILSPVMNAVTCFGEEWGWRGYLVPKLSQHLSAIPTMLISGIIWGLWHAPLTIVGHNYGIDYPGFPYAGIAMMCLFCVVLGIILSFVTLKTKSCIPAIIGHGAINGIASIGVYFTQDGGNPFVGPGPTGIIGMLPTIFLAVILVIRLKKDEKTT